MDKQQLVSVIVPIYNVEGYLAKCLESICRQTYHNLELILVDDGSTDLCGSICDEYAKKDSRIKVIHKANGGLSDARNAALDCCRGEWVSFIDSDDYVAEDYIETLYGACMEHGAKIGVCGRYDVYPSGVEERFQASRPALWTVEDALRNFLVFQGIHVGAWGKLYQAEIFNGIRYPLGELSEDVAVFMPILQKVDKIAHTGKSSYYYVHRENSISAHLSEKQITAFYNYKKLFQEVLANYEQLKKEAAYYYISALMYFLNLYYCDRICRGKRKEHREFYHLVYQECRKMAALGFTNPYFTLYEKSLLFLYVTKCFGIAKRLLGRVKK